MSNVFSLPLLPRLLLGQNPRVLFFGIHSCPTLSCCWPIALSFSVLLFPSRSRSFLYAVAPSSAQSRPQTNNTTSLPLPFLDLVLSPEQSTAKHSQGRPPPRQSYPPDGIRQPCPELLGYPTAPTEPWIASLCHTKHVACADARQSWAFSISASRTKIQRRAIKPSCSRTRTRLPQQSRTYGYD